MTSDLRAESPRRQAVWATLLLIAVTAAVYSPVLGHRFIESWDDTPAILTNPDYNPPTLAKLGHYWVIPPKDTFYVPMTYTLWGLLAMVGRSSAPAHVPFNPAIFYPANLLSHAISAGLVFLILRRLLAGNSASAYWRLIAACLGSAVFALHPLQVEGVATASSVYTPLSGTFGFFAIWQYLSFSDALGNRNGKVSRPWVHYGLATLGLVLALLTKPTAVAVPVVVGVIELTLGRSSFRAVVLTLGPWIVLSLLATWLNEHSSPGATVFVPEPPFRPLVPLDAVGFYLMKVVAPVRLASDYGRSPRWLVEHPIAWLTCLVPLGVFAITWRMRRRAPLLLAAFGVFVAGLLPSIGIVPFDFQHYSTVADRYAYVAMLGPAIAVAFVVLRFRLIAAESLIALLGILIGLTVVQLRYWRDDWHLMARTLEINPRSLSAANGFRYLLTGWHDTHGFPAPRSCSISQPTLVRVGDLMMARREWPIAAEAYRRAIVRGAPSAAIYDRLGAALLAELDPKSAHAAFKDALRIDSNDAEARQGRVRTELMLNPQTAP